MLGTMKNAAENYRNGLTTADEFVAKIVEALVDRYNILTTPDAPPATNLDVDQLAEVIHAMKLSGGGPSGG